MNSGSREAIFYAFCQFVDEMWHAAEWLFPHTHFRFCQWAYRKEMAEVQYEYSQVLP